MAGQKIYSTLCYIEKDGQYLMLFRNKKEHDPCEGKWVGVGGKFEPGESADECLLREVWEETGLHLTEYQFCGIVHFVSDTWPDEDMYLFTATGFKGQDCFGNLEAGSKFPNQENEELEKMISEPSGQVTGSVRKMTEMADLVNQKSPMNQKEQANQKEKSNQISLKNQFECSEGELYWIPKDEIDRKSVV